MTVQAKAARMTVGNAPLEGVSDRASLPTFVIDLSGLSVLRREAEVAELAMLQTMAPIFRIVVVSDAPLFNVVRPYGWPVEHLASPESMTRLLDSRAEVSYRRERMKVIMRHYDRAEFVSARTEQTAAHAIALALAAPELLELLPVREVEATASLRWSEIADRLRQAEMTRVDGEEGSVTLNATGNAGQELLIIAGDGERASQVNPPAGSPFRVAANFSPHSSAAFESMVYVRLTRAFGERVSVVRPWREATLHDPSVARWIDLGLESGSFKVLNYYADTYRVLAGSQELDWNRARLYAAARRVARDVSRLE